MKKILLLAFLVLPLSVFAQKFGHFNSADTIQLMPEYKTAQTELQKLQSQMQILKYTKTSCLLLHV